MSGAERWAPHGGESSCNTRPIPGLVVLTPGSSLESYIVSTNQHGSFVRNLSSLMRTRENFSVGYCWGPSASEGPQKHDLTMFSK
jgi:hypothetical protein